MSVENRTFVDAEKNIGEEKNSSSQNEKKKNKNPLTFFKENPDDTSTHQRVSSASESAVIYYDHWLMERMSGANRSSQIP